MALYEVNFDSFNKRDNVYGWIYVPIDNPVAIIQVVHGLGEHSRRYQRLITGLVDAGFVVCADDHVGHGKTGMSSGIWQDTGDTGYQTFIADEHTLATMVAQQFPNLPFFMFGHSWGSMIARSYATEYGNELAGLALCGVAEQMAGPESINFGELEAEVNLTGGGEPAPLELLGQLFAGAVERFGENPHPNDWIASYRPIVEDHASDPFNNFNAHMTTRFLRDFIALYQAVTDDNYAASLPTNMPVLLLGGDQDPVGNFGEGTYHAANKMWQAGMRDIRTHVFSGLRHEVHNEPESRDEVKSELIEFVRSHLPIG